MIRRNSIILLIFLIQYNLVIGQKDEKPLSRLIKEADEYFRIEDYDAALRSYLSILKKDPENGMINYKTGVCYLKTIQKNEAFSYLEKSNNILGEKILGKDIFLNLGLAYFYNEKFVESKSFFKTYLKQTKEGETENTEAKKLIQMAQNAIELSSNPLEVRIENLGPLINSIYPEYAPVISADESILIYTSRRPETNGGGKDPEDNMYFEDIYISYKENEKWSDPKPISNFINTSSHDASVGLSADGQNLFIYRDENNGDLFSCRLIGEEWSEPVALPNGINTKYWEPSISINSEGTSIYFSSDRPGGLGGKDIYMSKRLPGGFGFGTPINLGTNINTPEDDDGPFIHPDNQTLYFSSKGHKSMGGYDIFKSTLDSNNKWTKPINIGYPINTPLDDIYFVLSADGKRAYYASSREEGGFGDKDIYVINMPEEKKLANVVVLKGIITDKANGKPLGAKIIVRDNETSEIISISDANSATGAYLVVLSPGKNYGITVDNSHYVFHSENFDIPKLNTFDVLIKNISLQKFVVGSQIILKNIFFDTAKWDLRKESTSELEKLFNLLKENPKIDIEIGGHTDSIGTEQNNQILSDRRANAVVEYLINKGINSNRLKAKGYGEAEPIADNGTLEGRQMNRRTVMEITYVNF